MARYKNWVATEVARPDFAEKIKLSFYPRPIESEVDQSLEARFDGAVRNLSIYKTPFVAPVSCSDAGVVVGHHFRPPKCKHFAVIRQYVINLV